MDDEFSIKTARVAMLTQIQQLETDYPVPNDSAHETDNNIS